MLSITLHDIYVFSQVRRVKAESRFGTGPDAEPAEIADGVTLEWDPADYDSNPASRFPMGC